MAKNTPPVMKEKNDIDPVFDEVIGKFNASRNYIKKGFRQTWKDCRNLYNNKRVRTNYVGSSDTFIPETFTIIQSVKSNVVGGKIKIDYMPTRSDQFGDTRTLNSLMEQIWVDDKTKLKASWAVDDCLQVGNGYLWQYVKNGMPCNIYIPTEDNFFDPDATNYENLEHGGYRYTTTIDKLKEETKVNIDYDETDPKSKLRIPRYQNLGQVNAYAYKSTNDKTAKQLREEMVAGSILGEKNDKLVEVIVYHDLEKLVKIANRCVVIENVDTPFKRDATTIQSVDDQGNPVPVELPEIPAFIPVAPARDYVDGAMWYARGEIEIISDLQELLNDTQNQKTDNLNFTLNRMWTLDPSQAHKINEIQSVPGAVFTIPPGSLEPVQNTSIGPEADTEIIRIQQTMRRSTAADELVQGSQSTGNTTATEVNATIAQAGTRFSSKLENFETEFFTILAQNMFKILQINLTHEQAVRMLGQDGVEWKNYNPGEFLGGYDVKVMLDNSARTLKEEEKQNAMQFYLLASKQPNIDLDALFKMTATVLFNKDDATIEKLIKPPAPLPVEPNLPKVSVSLKDVSEPYARAMILSKAIDGDLDPTNEMTPQVQAPNPQEMNPQMPSNNIQNMPTA